MANGVLQPRHLPATVCRRSGDAAGRQIEAVQPNECQRSLRSARYDQRPYPSLIDDR